MLKDHCFPMRIIASWLVEKARMNSMRAASYTDLQSF
jgi:hypothetical protein